MRLSDVDQLFTPGAVAVFGADPAKEAALTMENIGRDLQFERAPGALEHLEAEVDRLMPALRSTLSSLA